MANMTARMALEEAIKYAKQREAFGKPLTGFQVTRHKLADMATLVEASTEFTYRVAAKIGAGVDQIKEVSMAKNFACSVSDKVTYDAVQIFGGYGYMREYRCGTALPGQPDSFHRRRNNRNHEGNHLQNDDVVMGIGKGGETRGPLIHSLNARVAGRCRLIR